MFESLFDIKSLHEELKTHQQEIYENFSDSEVNDQFLHSPEKSIDKGILLINFDNFIQCRVMISVISSKVIIDDINNMKGLLSSLELYLTLKDSENFTDDDYDRLINIWVENEEEYHPGFDSMDEDFVNEFQFDDSKEVQTIKKEERGNKLIGVDDITQDMFNQELESKEREIIQLRKDFEEYKKLADYNMHKKFEEQNKLQTQKTELFEEVDQKMTNIVEIVKLFNDAVLNVHGEIHQIQNQHNSDLKFYEKIIQIS